MATAGLFRRILPCPPAIEFASPQGKLLFAEALQGGTMEGFFKLISYYQTQSDPAFCGLASLSMVLNALAIDPGRTWKGPWRWFDDSMLDCCEPLAKVRTQGIMFGKVACLAVCNGAEVEAFRADQSHIDDFRRLVSSCVSSEDRHVIVSYHRKIFKQTGSGHFSPIGGYHTQKDMVLILDVARFKYPPHWVPLTLLWEAMDSVDEASGCRRGFMIISRHHRAPSILYTLSCKKEGWTTVAKYLKEDVPILFTSRDIDSIEDMLAIIFKAAPDDLREFIKWVAEVRRQDDGSISEEEKGRLALKEEVLKQIRETELFKHVSSWLALESSACKGVVTSSSKDGLPDIAANACCQGAELLAGNICVSGKFCCKETNVKVVRTEKERPVTLVSGTITTGGIEEMIDTLIPLSHTASSESCSSDKNHCCCMHPSTSDALAMLLLLMPQENWSNIKEEKLQSHIRNLVSIENLPPLLQEEVLHLQRQLQFLTAGPCTNICSTYPA